MLPRRGLHSILQEWKTLSGQPCRMKGPTKFYRHTVNYLTACIADKTKNTAASLIDKVVEI